MRYLTLALSVLVAVRLLAPGVDADDQITATFTVDSSDDQQDSDPADHVCRTALGGCTLRAAIEQANSDPSLDLIKFQIPGESQHTIRPTSPLPVIIEDITIDGYTQPGSARDSNGLDLRIDAVIKIELDGSLAGPAADGLVLDGPDQLYGALRAFVSGLAVNRFSGHGIKFDHIGGRIEGNYVGTDGTGTIALGNGGSGLVGISSPAFVSTNLFSGNAGFGAFLMGANDDGPLASNIIGSDRTGTIPLGNGAGGVYLNPVGDFPLRGNLISANDGPGVQVLNSGEVYISRNLIGTQADGKSPLGNAGSGLIIVDTAGGTSVGGSGGNTISFNEGIGIELVGPETSANLIGNSVHSNAGLGIDLGGDGITRNDHDDDDAGPNLFQNFADVTSTRSDGGFTTIRGSLRSEPPLSQYDAEYSLEFYSSPGCDASGYGEGQQFLARAYRSVNQRGRARFEVTLPVAVADGHYITMTTDKWDRGTSEFSRCRIVR